jgi:hypothetical protein
MNKFGLSEGIPPIDRNAMRGRVILPKNKKEIGSFCIMGEERDFIIHIMEQGRIEEAFNEFKKIVQNN